MNRKGIWEEAADLLLGGAILMVAFTSFMIITNMDLKKADETIEQKILGLDNSEVFLSYLGSEYEGKMLSDYITEMHYSKSSPRDGIDWALQNAYSREMCWSLYKDGKLWAESNGCDKDETIFDSEIVMPMPDNQNIKLRLDVKGYKA